QGCALPHSGDGRNRRPAHHMVRRPTRARVHPLGEARAREAVLRAVLTRDVVTPARYDPPMTRSRVVVVAILAAASLGGWRLGQARHAATAEWTVVRVVDGDTIDVSRGSSGNDTDTVRLLGINTPEPHHPPKPVECF